MCCESSTVSEEKPFSVMYDYGIKIEMSMCACTAFEPHIHKHKRTQSCTHICVDIQQCLTNEKHLSLQQEPQLV